MLLSVKNSLDELSENGINTADDFESAYFYQTDSWNAERDFAQYYAEEIACIDLNEAGINSFLIIDWQATWDRALCYDFFTIEFDGETYFFSNTSEVVSCTLSYTKTSIHGMTQSMM